MDEIKDQESAGENQDPVTEEVESGIDPKEPDVTVDEEAAAEVENAEQRADRLDQELAAAKDQLLRVAAEFENFKKRMEREKGKLLKYAGENILRELLTTLDNLDRAIGQGQASGNDDTSPLQSLLEGLDLTQKGLVATLEKFDVEPLDSVGQAFNPDEQDALTMEASEEIPANHVVREFAKGYRFKDRVLRHAQVVVSSGPAE